MPFKNFSTVPVRSHSQKTCKQSNLRKPDICKYSLMFQIFGLAEVNDSSLINVTFEMTLVLLILPSLELFWDKKEFMSQVLCI